MNAPSVDYDSAALALSYTGLLKIQVLVNKLREIWSRRGELNAPSVDYNSTALALSYTGVLLTSISSICV